MKQILIFVVAVIALLVTSGSAEAQILIPGQPGDYDYNRGYRQYGGYRVYDNYYGNYSISGVKFNFKLIEKKDLKLVKRSVVSIDGGEIGIADDYDGFWNGILELSPGMHQVAFELEDGRDIQITVRVMPERITKAYPRFRPEKRDED
ncbi:MAG: hypothetical protein AAB897_00685 [Patescibacteria group bacterium]